MFWRKPDGGQNKPTGSRRQLFAAQITGALQRQLFSSNGTTNIRERNLTSFLQRRQEGEKHHDQ